MLEFHPYANIFDLLEGDEFSELVEDIDQHGLLEPIVLHDGKILDGRNRFRACLEAAVDPTFISFGDWRPSNGFDFQIQYLSELENPIAYVVSRNMKRRHLSQSQRSMAAAKAKNLYAEQAKERMRDGGGDHKSEAFKKSGVVNLPPPISSSNGGASEPIQQTEKKPAKAKARDQAGHDFHVSGKSVDYASKVLDKGVPELAAAVEHGKISVSAAAKIADLPEDKQRKAVENPESVKAKDRKPTELQKLKAELAEAREVINDQQDAIRELTDEVQSQADITGDERQLQIKLNGLRERIRVLESQRDDLMNQVNEYKREVKALRRRLGDE